MKRDACACKERAPVASLVAKALVVLLLLLLALLFWWLRDAKTGARTETTTTAIATTTVPTGVQEYELLPGEIKGDAFYDALYRLAQEPWVRSILEIGSSSGEGSTDAFARGIALNPSRPTLYCMEVSRARFAKLQAHYAQNAQVRCYNASSVPLHTFPSEQQVRDFMARTHTTLNQYGVPLVLQWLERDRAYLRAHGAQLPQDGILLVKQRSGVADFDLVLIDGSEFTGAAELDRVYGARCIALDDVNAYKNYDNYQRLKRDARYRLVEEDWSTRNGYAIFRRRDEK